MEDAALLANMAFGVIKTQAWLVSRLLLDGKVNEAQQVLREITETCDEGRKALGAEN